MCLKKYFIFVLILIITLFPISVNADDNDILEFEDIDENEIAQEVSSNISTTPIISSKHTIAIERSTNRILYESSGFEKTAMASTTKIMTAILAIEQGNLADIITVSKKATTTTGSRFDLEENMKISLNDLLYGLMLRSGNDAAVAIAEYISGSVENFATLMNEKANTLNMYSTHFVTPNGLDDKNHYTTAYDMAILTNYALNNPTFLKIVGTKTTNISWKSSYKTISNTNELLGNYPRSLWG